MLVRNEAQDVVRVYPGPHPNLGFCHCQGALPGRPQQAGPTITDSTRTPHWQCSRDSLLRHSLFEMTSVSGT